MKLQSVKFAFGIFYCGEFRVFRAGCSAETSRQRRHLIPVTIPDVDLFAESIEQLRAVGDVQHAWPIFAALAELHLAAKMMRH